MHRPYPRASRTRLTIFSLIAGLGLGVHVACSSSSADSNADCEEGAEGCTCYPNGSCDSGLECHSDLCVEGDTEGSSGGPGGSNGGSGGSAGSSGGSGGSAGSSGGSGGSGGSSGGSGGSNSTSDAGGSNSGGGGNCEEGAEGCSCYPNDTCNDWLACQASSCVAPASGGAGGAGSGGASTNSGGSGGSPTTDAGGTGGTGGEAGTGGAATNGTGGTGGSNEVSDPAIIDDFSSCDGVISRVDGRDGGWFAFGDEDVNVLPTSDIGAQEAPDDFQDTSCAAWYTTGCSETATYCEFAGLGFVFFEDESPYDLSGYQALQVQREGDAQWIVVHMTGGLTFGASLPAGIGTDSVYFYTFTPSGDTDIYAVPDWSQVTKIEFTALTPEASGFAVYDIRLY